MKELNVTDTLQTLQTRLTEAEAARHKLLTGVQEVKVELDGFGSTTYTQASLNGLERYIVELQNKIAALSGKPRRGPLRVSF